MKSNKGTVVFKEIEFNIEYLYNDLVPGKMFESDGSPGWPEEEREFYITKICVSDSLINLKEIISEDVLIEIEKTYLETNEIGY